MTDLAPIDHQLLAALYARRHEPPCGINQASRIEPIPVDPPSRHAREIGEAALRAGRVAVLVVAGGQGSRLGFENPKGMYPVGPVSRASLFAIHARKVVALQKRYQSQVLFLIMTSPATHQETVDYFEAHGRFGLPKDDLIFFQQGMMPALHIDSGELILEAPGRVFLSPNGHGGALMALADHGLLNHLRSRGIDTLFYFQVDNPLVNLADPSFIGQHLETESEFSSKVVFKSHPHEKVGLLALIDGRCGIIEYSDLPAELAEARLPDGTLRYKAGNPAIHIFQLDFLERITSGGDRLQFHIARKKVPYYDPRSNQLVQPQTENALKFELFIFDALPKANRWLAVQTRREDEFAPLKNASGPDSPETVQQMIVDRAARWLESAGASVPRDSAGRSRFPIEICPLYALDADECRAKLPSGFTVTGPTYLHE